MDVFGRFLGGSGSADRQQKAQDLERSGLENMRAGDLQQARADLQKAVGLEPRNAILRGNLAMVLARLDMLDNAEKEFQTAIKLSPGDEELRFAHGQLLERMFRPIEAAAEYSIGSTLDLGGTRSLVALASLEAKGEDLEKAESYIRIALERNGDDPQAWACLCEIHLTRLLQEQGDLDRGIGMLSDAYNSSSGDNRVRAALDKKSLRRTRVAHGIELYRQMAKIPPASQGYYRKSESARLSSAGGTDSTKPESDQWLDVMYGWYSSLGVESSASTSMLATTTTGEDAPVSAAARPQAERTQAEVSPRFKSADSRPAANEAPAAGLTNLVDVQRTRAISQLEFDVAREPSNSKLRRDLSILYLQVGRVAEAKVQARKAEEAMRQRHVGARPAE
jgi:tetratricopeptide (TPR) repeat protein